MNCVNDSHMIVSGLPPAEHDQHCVQVQTLLQKDKKTNTLKRQNTKTMIVSGLPPAEHDQHCVQVQKLLQKDKYTKKTKYKKYYCDMTSGC